MNKIFTILTLVTLASCSQKVLPSVETVTKETITTDTVYVPKETIITLPGDTLEIYEAIPCPEQTVFHKEATSKSGTIKAIVDIRNGNLKIDCKTDSLQKRIQWLEAHSNQVKIKETTVTVTSPPKKYIPKWVWWLLGINIAYVLLRIAILKYKLPIKL